MGITIDQIVKAAPVVPVIVIDDLADAVPLATALFNGGLKVLEITLRTECALAAITAMKDALPDAIVGAGTIVKPSDIDAAVAAGATFLVSPGTSPELVEALKKSPVPVLPGVSTPSEAMKLYSEGFTHLKFFPAEAAGGVSMLKSIGGPLPQITFCPTGGINLEKAPTYLKLPSVHCVGGSWMCPADLVKAKDWAEIEKRAREAASLGA